MYRYFNEKAKINNASETTVQHQQTVETKQEKLIESNRDEIKKTIRYLPQLNRLKHQDIENQPTLKDASVNTDHDVFIYKQPNIKTERLVRIQNDETVSESENEFINTIGNIIRIE